MPELPEVETIKRELKNPLVGKTITEIEVLSAKQFPQAIDLVRGQTITALERIGKNLLLRLAKNNYLHIHLKMTGQLIYRTAEEIQKQAKLPFPDITKPHPAWEVTFLPNRHTRVVLHLSSGDRLYFNDLRKFGYIKLISTSQYQAIAAKLGTDALGEGLKVSDLVKELRRSNLSIKVFLLDQTKLAGIGNIYASEILFEAKLNPFTKASDLSSGDAKVLLAAIVLVLKRAVASKGTSAKDEAYLRPFGQKGEYQTKAKVYGREGQPCPLCGLPIVSQKQAQRTTYFCPSCQPVDRTSSKSYS